MQWHVSRYAMKYLEPFLENRPYCENNYHSDEFAIFAPASGPHCFNRFSLSCIHSHFSTKARLMIKWHCNVGFWGIPSQHPPDNNYNDSFSFIIEQTSLFVCVLAWGDPSVSKWRVFNYKHKQTTPRTYVLVYCNDGDISMKIMSSHKGLLIWRYQILNFFPPCFFLSITL